MNIDLLAADSQIIVNKRLAELFGLAEAVYLAEVFNISKKAVNKKKFDESTGYFTLNRKYIEKQTTITPTKQCEYDQKFQQAGIIEVSENSLDVIRVDTSKVISLITCQDIKALRSVTSNMKVDKEVKKETKRNAIIQMLKNSIRETNTELRAALESWVEVVYDKGMCKKAQVALFEDQMLNYYGDDLGAKISVVKICTAQAYKNFDFGKQIYEKNKTSVRTTQQKVSSGLDTSHVF